MANLERAAQKERRQEAKARAQEEALVQRLVERSQKEREEEARRLEEVERKPEQDKYILREELKSSANLPQGETRPYDLKDYLRQHNGNFRLEEFENFIKSK